MSDDFGSVLAHENLRYDLMAVARAVIRHLETEDAERWVAWSGPLPAYRTERQGHIEVFARGLWETSNYLCDCQAIV
ncbi:MAG: hypothetical protein F4089_02190 [Gammaproteobacteria bacterium]|nr:hypothetical protein [Gammaproteobacteria bacterium]